MKVLVMNCGSSSLKYQLIDMEHESVLAKGICERIGADGSVLTHKPTGKDKYVVEQAMPDHGVAVQLVLDALQDKEHGVIESADEITAIGHRVLHAGTIYSDATLVTEDVKKVVRDCFDLGPLHNPANLIGIEACEKAMPGKPNVAVFDTAFGMNIPKKAAMWYVWYTAMDLMRSLLSVLQNSARLNSSRRFFRHRSQHLRLQVVLDQSLPLLSVRERVLVSMRKSRTLQHPLVQPSVCRDVHVYGRFFWLFSIPMRWVLRGQYLTM